ncbi:MAG: hypothetical protein ACTHNM_06835 [Dyella sp.]|uniref:hypothetical protein n=1 Tax=Dyella sp. TaxID=1869338 RepID=UPI003F81FD72
MDESHILEAIATLKAQQLADAVAIKCLIAAQVSGELFEDVWLRESSSQVVSEHLAAHTHGYGQEALEAFSERLAYWQGVRRAAGRS